MDEIREHVGRIWEEQQPEQEQHDHDGVDAPACACERRRGTQERNPGQEEVPDQKSVERVIRSLDSELERRDAERGGGEEREYGQRATVANQGQQSAYLAGGSSTSSRKSAPSCTGGAP